ncbi:hypothetical protein CFE70_004594 [Pyrenophora teres f. teres 0-1]|uniref:Uncharacterized protein n=2 Tax=Pyrenophora teres f. teres TaxID=97479 RepID=E3S923_PYRTT|nr:hypothetical protein PTT_19513 [Pyrenophora teres f. teres 0-1]KAE8833540.1 hypothetical protein HRS9139_05359 [Pyrenophora teres f. teres]KAE8840692.1 hypothetical protein PTNB85_04091 [Pyrenophora teres f. teres]KAE8849169.1 hypothetical protein HRS9122_03185 [Pyrenophora teres f. teres]KAE8864187.1 hypothetical protein PTNB29_04151 [Pyrenophora teres f. teres]
MRFTTLATTLAAASQATALLSGLAVPAVIAPGSHFNLTLIAEPRAELHPEVAISYGYSPSTGYPGALGDNVKSVFLGPISSNTKHNVTISAKAPSREELIPGRPSGPGTDERMYLNIAFFQLSSNKAYPMIKNFNVSILFGEKTSDNLVASTIPLNVLYS